MTVDNRKCTAVKYNKSRHLAATDKVGGGKDKETVSGQVARVGNFYLLRLRENPHHAEWVTF